MKVDMRMSSSTSSNIKATASSWSAGSRRAAEVKCNTRVNIEAKRSSSMREALRLGKHEHIQILCNSTIPTMTAVKFRALEFFDTPKHRLSPFASSLF